jgi:SAM-dependent methyltransferase
MGLNTDKTWERYGEVDPYFGVITNSKYHSWVLTDQARDEFFRSGEEHVQRILKILREINPGFSPNRAIDFGCGVGRVALPLARESASVLGVDVAAGMLSEAQKNAAERGVSSVRFAPEVSGYFDLVHSFIVIQHIPPRRGLPIVRDLVSRVLPGGMIVLQVPYYWNASVWHKLATRVTRVAPITMRVLNLTRGRGFSYPTMRTFCYSVRSIFAIFHNAGINNIRICLDTSAGPHHASMTLYGQNGKAK